jgi:hypothetical protein
VPSPLAIADDELLELARSTASSYSAAPPYPHAVFDGIFREDALVELAAEFPALGDERWKTYPGEHEAGKQEASDPMAWGPAVSAFLEYLSSGVWMRFVEALSGIGELTADPHGGGMHQSGPGAFLDVHADFNRHRTLDLDRRVNAIVYLNPGWREEDGGLLELWNEGECVERVVPVFNRCVLFSTSETSFHGHPTPVGAGIDPATGTIRRRRSIALYYYSPPVEARAEKHSTIWLRDRA